MRLIYINLDRATARREKIEKRFAELGVKAERLSATDGRALRADERAMVDDNARCAITPYPLSDNETACWISHRRAMENLIASGEKMAAILEDDCELADNFPSILSAIEKMDMPFDIIDLHRKFKKREVFLPRRELGAGLWLGRLGPMHMGNIGYVITRDAALRFLAATPRLAHAVDKEMHRYWVHGFNLYALSQPIVVTNDEGHSFIEETRAQDNGAPRPTYPDAYALSWRLRRYVNRVKDSVQKRRAFNQWVREQAC